MPGTKARACVNGLRGMETGNKIEVRRRILHTRFGDLSGSVGVATTRVASQARDNKLVGARGRRQVYGVKPVVAARNERGQVGEHGVFLEHRGHRYVEKRQAMTPNPTNATRRPSGPLQVFLECGGD